MIIHYFKDGLLNYSYEESWKKFCPDAVFKKWDSTNLPVDKYPILKKYIDSGRWSVLSDFARRYTIYTEGGIYLDYDIELIKPIDHLVDTNFVCIESRPTYANTAVCGGIKGNSFFKWMLEDLVKVLEKGSVPFGKFESYLGVQITTQLIKKLAGLPEDYKELPDEYIDTIQKFTIYPLEQIITLPKSHAFPYNWNQSFRKDMLTEDTFSIHWWRKGW